MSFGAILAAGFVHSVDAELLVEYEIDTVSSPATVLGSTLRNGATGTLDATDLVLVGERTNRVAGDYFGKDWPATGGSYDPSNYYEFSVGGLDGYAWEPEKIIFSIVRYFFSNHIGPRYWTFRASTDGFATEVGLPMIGPVPAGSDTHYLYTVEDFSALGAVPLSEVTFRLIGWHASHVSNEGGLANSASSGWPAPNGRSNLLVEGNVIDLPGTPIPPLSGTVLGPGVGKVEYSFSSGSQGTFTAEFEEIPIGDVGSLPGSVDFVVAADSLPVWTFDMAGNFGTVELVLTYDEMSLFPFVNESDLVVHHFTSTGEWVTIVPDEVDEANDTVRFTVNELSPFTVGLTPPSPVPGLSVLAAIVLAAILATVAAARRAS